MDVVAVKDLSRYYGKRVGVERLNLTIREGEVFGFLGPNGAGKTTTIRVLLGLLRPSAGSASVLDRDCWRHSAELKRQVGYVPGDLRLYPWLTARSGLRLADSLRGADSTANARRLLERFELEPDLPAQRMSRGMRQKLGLVLALAHRPRLLILDEPTSGLDPLMQRELAAELGELVDAGSTVFFSSHTLSEVEQLCDRIAIVRRGRIVADESLDSLRRRARRTVVIQFADADSAGVSAPPPWLQVDIRRGDRWTCQLEGEADGLIAWLAAQPVRDVEIGAPDLETLFRRYYEPGDVEQQSTGTDADGSLPVETNAEEEQR